MLKHGAVNLQSRVAVGRLDLTLGLQCALNMFVVFTFIQFPLRALGLTSKSPGYPLV